jgi:hypothetical protein
MIWIPRDSELILVKRCGINLALWFLVILIKMSKLVLDPK